MSSITTGETLEISDPRRPVTIGLILFVVSIATFVVPVVQGYESRQAALSERVSVVEREQMLRGAQLDRIEGDTKELLRRVR